MSADDIILKRLKEGEIAGRESLNPIISLLLHLKTDGEYIDINPDGLGSLIWSLNFPNVLRSISEHISSGVSLGLEGAFAVSLASSTFTVSPGSIRFLDTGAVHTAPSITSSFPSGTMYVWCAITPSSSTLSSGTSLPLILTTDYMINIPIARVTSSAVFYYHVGDILLLTPYKWLSGYDPSVAQALVHDTAGLVQWAASEEDESDSTSDSSSDSSSDASDSTSDSSSSSGGTAAGHLSVTKYNEQESSPITCDGTYTLVSGNANDTSGVWRHSNGDEIYYSSGGWVLSSLTGYFTGEIMLSIIPGADRYDPTTWTGGNRASALLSPAYNTYLECEFITS